MADLNKDFEPGESADLASAKTDSGLIKSILIEQEEKSRTAYDPMIVVGNAINQLKDRDRDVLIARYGLEKPKPVTLEQVGKKLGVTRERVRQIESAAIKKLAASPGKELSALIKLINSYMNNNGGVVSLSALADYFKVDKDERKELESNALTLIMDINPNVKSLKKSKELRFGWMKKDFDADLLAPVMKVAKNVLMEASSPMMAEDLWKRFGDMDAVLQGKINSLQLLGILSVGSDFDTNKSDEWGLTSWPTIHPKRIRDKVFLVLEEDGDPMHFVEITEKINQTYPEKKVLNRTVHNELIGDKRFVLVGRGIYALKEWGYKPGVVADVIKDVLEKNGAPMSVSDITKKVLERRKVKPNTVVANLQNKSKFKKASKGMYTLA